MKRRDFIIKSGSALSLAMLSGKLMAQSGTLKKFGCQLYSVRDLMPKDAVGTMKQLAEMGYTQFESYSADPYWGMSAADCKTFLKDIGVQMISTHMGLDGVTDEMAANAATAGLEYVICPYIGMQPDEEAWIKIADKLNAAGEICNKHGVKFGYHNHAYSFAEKDGVKGQEIMIKNTNPNLVCFELDMCWSEAAGENSVAHLEKYGERYELCHVKQLEHKGGDGQRAKQTDLANGIIDYEVLLKAAKKIGMKYYIVEQEEYPIDSITSMKSDAEFMKNITF